MSLRRGLHKLYINAVKAGRLIKEHDSDKTRQSRYLVQVTTDPTTGKKRKKIVVGKNELMQGRKDRGLLHKIYNTPAKIGGRFIGDVPHINENVKSVAKGVFDIPLVAEDIALATADTAKKVTKKSLKYKLKQYELKQKLKNEMQDDTGKFLKLIYKTSKAAVLSVKEEKNNYKRRYGSKAEIKDSKSRSKKYAPKRENAKLERKTLKEQYKKTKQEYKQAFLRSSTNLSLYKKFQQTQNDKYKFKNAKRLHKLMKKQARIEQKKRNSYRLNSYITHRNKGFSPITRFARHHKFKTLPTKFVGNNLKVLYLATHKVKVAAVGTAKQFSKDTISQKFAEAGQENDAYKVAETIVQTALRTKNQAKTFLQKQHESQIKFLSKEERKTHNNLKLAEEKMYKNDGRRQRTVKNKPKRSHYTNKRRQKMSDSLRKNKNKAAFGFSKLKMGAGEKCFHVILVLLPVIIAFCVLFAIVLFAITIVGNHTWVLGTYTASDENLSKAIEYWTERCDDLNKKVLNISDNDGKNWKSALENLGINTSGFTDKPNNFYFGDFVDYYGVTHNKAEVENDHYKIWCFVCAYMYNETANAGKKGSEAFEYWKFGNGKNNKVKQCIDYLFDTMYDFNEYYCNQSYWRELNSYNLTVEDGLYNIASGTGIVPYDGTQYPAIYFNEAPGGNLQDWACVGDNETYFVAYNPVTYEILNCKDGMKKTGYYFEDMFSSYSGNMNGNYIENNAFYNYYLFCPENPSVAYHYFPLGGYLMQQNNNDPSIISIPYVDAVDTELYATYNQYDDFANGYSSNAKYNNMPLFNYSSFWNDYCNSQERQIAIDNAPDWYYKDCILFRYYQREEYVTVCDLYYSVSNDKSVDDIAKMLWYRPENEDDPLNNVYEYYTTLCGTPNGNHQAIISPIEHKDISGLISDSRIFNRYGYDVQNWNERHCNINKSHKAIDIACQSNEKLVCPMDAKITKIDKNNDTIVLESEKNIFLWDNKNYKIKITLRNVAPLQHILDESSGEQAEYKENDIIKQGTPFAYAMPSYTCCDGTSNGDNGCCYVCMKIEIFDKVAGSPKIVDPMLLIY